MSNSIMPESLGMGAGAEMGAGSGSGCATGAGAGSGVVSEGSSKSMLRSRSTNSLSARMGAGVPDLQAWLGHADPAMSLHYAKAASGRAEQLAAAMSALATGEGV